MPSEALSLPPAASLGRTLSRWLWTISTPVLVLSVLPHWAADHWLLDLTTHFAMPCALTLAAATLLFALLGRKFAALVMLFGAALCGHRLSPLYLPVAPTGASQSTTLRAIVANASVENPTPERLCEWIEREQPDVFAVLEYSPLHQRALEPLRARYPHAIEAVQADPFGIALFSRLPLQEARRTTLGSPIAQAVFAVVEVNGARIGIGAAHPVPPISKDYSAARNLGFEQLVGELARLPRSRVVLADLNATQWSAAFRRLLADSSMRDGCEGFGFQGSWPAVLPALLRIPIDHVLVSEDLVVTRRELGPDVGSDHLPVVAEFAIATASVSEGQPRRR